MRNCSSFTKNSFRLILESYSLYPAKNYYFQGIYRNIMKYAAHKNILHHAFQFFQVYTQNLHFPAHKIACSMGRFCHDSNPVISHSFCFQQFSSKCTLNLASLILLQSQGCTAWIHAPNFYFSNAFNWDQRDKYSLTFLLFHQHY